MTEAKRTVEEVMGLVRAMQGEFSQSCDPEREALESAITTIIDERDALKHLLEDKCDDKLCNCGNNLIHLTGDCS